MTKCRIAPRSRSRRVALQALYQWQLAGHTPLKIEEQYLNDKNSGKLDTEYFQVLFRNIVSNVGLIDTQLSLSLDRPINQLDPIELSVLRIGVYELTHCIDVPWKVVINEAVELAKVFGGEQSHRYVNGILDKIAQQKRKTEIRS